VKAKGTRGLRAALGTPTGVLSLTIVSLLVVLAIVGPPLFGDRAEEPDTAHILETTSSGHLLGTDNLGRDILARVLVATRSSLLLAVLAVLVAAAIGIPWGALPAVLGRRAGRLVAASIEFSVAFPALLLAIVIAVVVGAGPAAAVAAIGCAAAPQFARLTQTLAASVAGSDYVAAARALGVRRGRMMRRYILPNVAEPIILNTTIAIGYALLAIAGLSFLGLGVQAPSYDWGRLLTDGLGRIYVTPWAALGPALAIVLAGMAFNGLGETLARAASTRAVDGRRRDAPMTGVDAPADAVRTVPDPVLEVRDLVVGVTGPGGPITPVRGISFSLARGQVVGIVGESGSGKSLTALGIAQLVPPPGEVSATRLRLLDHEVVGLPASRWRSLLGASLAMVFQDPGTSLNPAVRVGRQLAEVVEVHEGAPRREADRRAVEGLGRVRLSAPERRAHQHPHELSGGMRQRAMIAMGLMGEPALLIADEPTSALDVTVQADILRLLRQLNEETGAAILFISHDMAVVAELCDRVLVMYAGRVVEDANVQTIVSGAAHPYTRALLAAVPDVDTARDQPLATIPGRPPDPQEVGTGCAFAPRCPFATERCSADMPRLEELDAEHLVACWHPRVDAPVASGDSSKALAP
jgi:peptide/nickel transport system permease protein